MFWIEYRNPDAGRTLFETDDLEAAKLTLYGVVEVARTELIGFSENLDGVLDYQLAGVRLFPADEQAVA